MWDAGGVSQTNIPNTQLPPNGWYPDPAAPGQERFWDGVRWTQHVRPIVYQAAYSAPPSGPTTADGVPLAGWWARFGALFIDGLLMMVVTFIVAIPFYDALLAGLNAWLADAMQAAQVGGQMPDYTDPKYAITGPYAAITALSAVANMIYSAGLQMWKGGTVGMLALGLRVVPSGRGRDHHGLPMGAALVRNLAYQVMGLLPFVQIVNGLVPLAHPRRQTLHDLAGRTQVVRIR